MEKVKDILSIVTTIVSLLATLIVICKPLRDRVFGTRAIREGQKCLLRSDMLRTYYRHVGEKKIRQYEYENFVYEYNAYKALKGNSFIDRIYAEIQDWTITS